MKHVLIGGNGFVGRETRRLLEEQGSARIVVVDLPESFEAYPVKERARVVSLHADIAVPGTLSSLQLGPEDVVHHLATRLITPNRPRFGRDEFFRRCAVDGTAEVLKWMKANGNRKLIFWSTDMVYGPSLEVPRTETHPFRPFGPYGRSKVAAENLISKAVRDGDVTCTIFRPRLILGAGRLGIFELLFRAVDAGRPIPLIGPGTNRFQFVSVTDCARAALLAAEKGCPSATYNLGNDNTPEVYDLLSAFLSETGSSSRLIRTPAGVTKGLLRAMNLVKIAPMDPEQFEIANLEVSLDTTAVKRDLGWTPTQSDNELLLAAYLAYKNEQRNSDAA
ncbi:NAD(P)-dependent oxidoreductase [Maritimibacter sp. 55A14]|uniref:NAD-dependent epimerase/dehydratase family protein n=1 Tax=Maritimibacter sp. 55A14 TaxID=2174844 RepID=UPI000D60F0EF|nr:NAD(P)-dependent oxidoreductase [Maritimibacter sp. 55A14]PWE32943.1 NAD(P)-dependent oxidoreductase [Maritimibacter sp. 55A14]